MKTRTIAIVAVALWGLTALFLGWFMGRDWTRPMTDQRREIPLSPKERDQVLGEMRTVLGSVNGVLDGLSNHDTKKVEQAARAAGMTMAVDESAGLIAKLPFEFKEMGLGLHRGFDSLADAAKTGENPDELLRRITELTSRCNACHDHYRLGGTSPEAAAFLGPTGVPRTPDQRTLALIVMGAK